jgi:hypothetical protein
VFGAILLPEVFPCSGEFPEFPEGWGLKLVNLLELLPINRPGDIELILVARHNACEQVEYLFFSIFKRLDGF